MTDEERDRPGEMATGSEENPSGERNRKRPEALEDSTGLLPANEEADLGTALRSVYQQTVQEDIPQEMLDLLNRLT